MISSTSSSFVTRLATTFAKRNYAYSYSYARLSTTVQQQQQQQQQVFRQPGTRKAKIEERKKNRRSLKGLEGIPEFNDFLMTQPNQPNMLRRETTTVQMNIGLYCNQSCNHCHVESSPQRTEMMSEQVAKRVVELVSKTPTVHTVDLTGGAPELNSQFRYLVKSFHEMGLDIIDRCNLTVLHEPGQEDLAQYLADHRLHIVASLPCYTSKNVNMQRGSGVFQKSIDSLLMLNKLGYGVEGSGLKLDLVYNPVGPNLPGAQAQLQEDYKRNLKEDFGIVFNELFTITNMPIKRFADHLYRQGQLNEYMNLLVNNFNEATVNNVMCKDLVNISWDGKMYDCDFNQMLEIPLSGVAERSVFDDIDSFNDLKGCEIATDVHCYGCTAGAGSSCGGALET